MKIAILDLGSNSARMTIWNCYGEKREIIYNNRIYVRLSEGLSKDNLLKRLPQDRAISALKEFSLVLEKENCDKVISVATEALRRAENSKEFIDRAEKETKIKLEILSGDDEAKYDFYAAKNLIGENSAFIMDVGGGSLELIRVDKGELKGHVCLPLGAVVMSDRFSKHKKALENFFKETFSSLPLLKNCHNHFIIGLGGSIRSLFAYSVGVSDGQYIKKDEFFNIFEKLSSMDIESLKKEAVFSDRYDILTAGIAPFSALFSLTNAEKIIICNKGVREGILTKWIEQLI